MSAPAVRRPAWRQSALAAAVVALAACAAVVLAVVWRPFPGNPSAAPDFTLTDQDGRPFTLSALRGRPVAIFFGYTHCPDECPLVLAHLARAVRAAGVSRDVRVAFITVDPDHDTPSVLKRYVRLFSDDFVGLTGSLRTLEPIYAAYHMPRRTQAAAGGAQEILHGTTIYFVDRAGTIAELGNWDDSMPDIVRELRQLR